MADDDVRIWRPEDEHRVLLMAGRTTSYAVDPRGEYVFGVVAEAPMRSRRGRERRTVPPGRLVAWDPSAPHAGEAVGGRPWASRLMVVEAGGLAALLADEDDPLADVRFAHPVIDDPSLLRDFVRLHRSLERGATRLDRDEQLTEWLHAVVHRHASARGGPEHRRPHDERALRRARDYLAEHRERNVGLDELAAVAGVGKFRLVRLFRDRTGQPPHAFQLAERVRAARRLLERGEPVASVAAQTGFADQSHLHRHFQRTLGIPPGEYQRLMRT